MANIPYLGLENTESSILTSSSFVMQLPIVHQISLSQWPTARAEPRPTYQVKPLNPSAGRGVGPYIHRAKTKTSRISHLGGSKSSGGHGCPRRQAQRLAQRGERSGVVLVAELHLRPLAPNGRQIIHVLVDNLRALLKDDARIRDVSVPLVELGERAPERVQLADRLQGVREVGRSVLRFSGGQNSGRRNPEWNCVASQSEACLF